MTDPTQDPPQQILKRALALAGDGRLQDASALLAPLAARYPNVPAAVINHDEILRRLGLFEAAVAVLEGAVTRMPDQPVARFNLALALRGDGRLDEALAQYAEALRRQPDHGDGWYNQGNAQLDAGLYDDARASYQQALKRLPDARHAKVLNNLASAHILQRHPAEARPTGPGVTGARRRRAAGHPDVPGPRRPDSEKRLRGHDRAAPARL